MSWPKPTPGVGHRLAAAASIWLGLYLLHRAPENFSITLIWGILLVAGGVVETANEVANRKLRK